MVWIHSWRRVQGPEACQGGQNQCEKASGERSKNNLDDLWLMSFNSLMFFTQVNNFL